MAGAKKPWGQSRRARNLLGEAAPEFKASKKVRWRKTDKVAGGKACSSCGWASGVGHDRWCQYVEGIQG
jgi:hypothetical protein